MSLENVGKCDDIVWQFDRETQDAYYPFMDRLHTVMDIQRIPYDKETINKRQEYHKLSLFQQLTIAHAQDGILFTFDKVLLDLNFKNVKNPPLFDEEKFFPKDLEKWYQASLKLRVNHIESIN